ncbi:MAG: nucleotide-diphospho-sugar transferase [Cyclobacteriaceae bacterium]|jgi:hypothetical protein|nr:nucleotide-diphospho-sugar transferase [Cytophagales bacterium]HNP77386.1 nucleotide-diphospho-sugar transferase [Cyclobacteriaceae bacterium]HQQ82215.1 nucleotide-diphospho-sugar transferase [Cyclobacteriaceae bacterium]
MSSLNTPILFLLFNRPEQSRITFQRIREQRPAFLFIAADGPRTNHPDDERLCNQVRSEVLAMIDWDCKVKTRFREQNLGCGAAVSDAISWFFTEVESGIILEDDCLPIPFFFTYAEQMLKKYADVGHVMHISGNNFLTGMEAITDVFFSKYPHSWGWATWRNRWSLYTFQIPGNADFRLNEFDFLTDEEKSYWRDIFAKTNSGIINTWDYQWFHTIWRNKGVCLIPRNNLVVNIGFEGNATHTLTGDKRFDSLRTGEFKLHIFPSHQEADAAFDHCFFDTFLKGPSGLRTFLQKLRNWI